ncbi:MAG: hypothetical protein ACYDB7_10250 [Mycobacteriales bacterium]
MGIGAYHPTNRPQRITVEVEVLPGPHTESVIDRLVRPLVAELQQMGGEVTRVRVQIHGQMAGW